MMTSWEHIGCAVLVDYLYLPRYWLAIWIRYLGSRQVRLVGERGPGLSYHPT